MLPKYTMLLKTEGFDTLGQISGTQVSLFRKQVSPNFGAIF